MDSIACQSFEQQFEKASGSVAHHVKRRTRSYYTPSDSPRSRLILRLCEAFVRSRSAVKLHVRSNFGITRFGPQHMGGNFFSEMTSVIWPSPTTLAYVSDESGSCVCRQTGYGRAHDRYCAILDASHLIMNRIAPPSPRSQLPQGRRAHGRWACMLYTRVYHAICARCGAFLRL
jgi:hypothetical protein